ncbi:MAG: PQQ-binding-like beta-propeller repeat protein [Deltaproteobacteria bacterium]|nr:PQQ-binding-like beta-propeller repeat protein [Deltaproteobacteria bacterium]
MPVDHFPFSFAWSPDRRTLFVSSEGSVSAVDPDTGATLASAPVPNAFLGLAVSPDGTRIYASRSGEKRVVALAWDGAALTEVASFAAGGYPAGLAVSPDGTVLWIVLQMGGSLVALDAASGERLGAADTGGNPYTVLLSNDGRQAYVSVEREAKVRFFDVSDPRAPRRLGDVGVQKNPEALVLSADGARLVVANSDEDSVSVIDVAKRKVTSTVDLRPAGALGYGSAPNSLALSPDGRRLFVAQAADNAVRVIDLTSGALVGAIPTAWYPTAVTLSADGQRLYVANAKGVGSGPNGPSVTLHNDSSLELVELPPIRSWRRPSRGWSTTTPARLVSST